MKQEDRTHRNDSNLTSEKPLQSWKEIAGHLERDERTARRWEKSAGLPVRRHGAGKGSSVYAYPSELEAWRSERQPKNNDGSMRRWSVPGSIGLLVVLVGAWFIKFGPILNPPNPLVEAADSITIRQIWAGPDVSTVGAPTRDGRYLTFQDGSEDLAVHDIVTGEKRLLTSKDPRSLEFALVSVPSPDGKVVAYSWYNKDHFMDLRIVEMDGSAPRVLYASSEVVELEPTDWSPDGKKILAMLYRKDGGSQMALVSVIDGSVHVLKAFDRESPLRGRFSPDGRYIAYDFAPRGRLEEHDVSLLAVTGDREVPVVQDPANDVMFDWTPDGKRILFGSDRSGSVGAWWIEIADGRPRGTPELVKPDLGRDVNPMGFTRNGSYYYGVRTGMSDVYVADLDLATGRLLAAPKPVTQRFVGSNSNPDWSSDGRQLLYLSKRGPGVWGARAICLRDAESEKVRKIASKLDRLNWARLSPDGRSVLAAGRVDDGFPICRIDVQTGNFERVVQKALGWPAVWSRNGQAIFYVPWNNTAKTASIVARELATGQEKELYSIAEFSYRFCAGLALSRDGRQLAFAVREAKDGGSKILKVLAAAGGEARDLLRGVQMPFPGSIAWTPDGLSLLFTGEPRRGESETELWLISAQGGEPRKLDLTGKNMRELCIHPDGRRVAYTSGGDRKEVWVMEGFLPEP